MLSGLEHGELHIDKGERSPFARPSDQALRPRKRQVLRRFACNLLDRGLVCLAGLVAIGSLSDASIAGDTPIGLTVVWSTSLPTIPRLCYDKTPAVIYLRYDIARKTTSILKRELNGDEQVVGEIPGAPNERSLSCSQDGRTIAALGGDSSTLFLRRGTDTALYRLRRYWAYSNAGRYSFLAPDGNSITLPEKPELVSGPDLLHDIRIFPYKRNTVFFVDDYLYEDDHTAILKFPAVDGGWADHGPQFKRPAAFSANEIVRCGDHDVASLVGTESSRYLVLDDVPRQRDWLEEISVRKLFRKYNTPFLISGDYGSCGFPLLDHARWHATVGLARLDANGVQTFSLPYPEIKLINDNVSFSKDGCLVLVQGFWSQQQGEDNTYLLATQSKHCQ